MEYIFLTIVTAEIIYCAVLMRQIEQINLVCDRVSALTQKLESSLTGHQRFSLGQKSLILVDSQFSIETKSHKNRTKKISISILQTLFSFKTDRKLKLVVNETKD